MHIALVIGKKNSEGIPGKNVREIVGRPAAEYAFIAAQYSGLEKIFVSTDSEEIAEIGKRYGATHIVRPAHLATPDSLTEDVLIHAYKAIISALGNTTITTISILFCNNPAINVHLLKNAREKLINNPEYDSCFSVVNYDMFTPARARKLSSNGSIQPYVDLECFDKISSIRDSAGKCYFCDLSIQVLKPICFEIMDEGQLPFKWQGRKSLSIENEYGFDIDSEWQFVVIEHWLKSKGFRNDFIPWEEI